MRKNLCYGDVIQFEVHVRESAGGTALPAFLFSEGSVDSRVHAEIMKKASLTEFSAEQVSAAPCVSLRSSL